MSETELPMDEDHTEKFPQPLSRKTRTRSFSEKLGIQYAGFSAVGPVRENNEDSFNLPFEYADQEKHGILLLVADGAGGIQGGEIARRLVASYLPALFYAETQIKVRDRLEESIEMCNSLLRWKQRQEGMPPRMLTTLVVVVIHQEKVRIGFVGDSRAYLIKADGSVRLLTEDHTYRFEEEEDKNMVPRSGIITRALGLEDEVVVDIHKCSWMRGDCLMLCSDGLNELTEEEISSLCLATDPTQSAEALVKLAHELDGSDNATAVVARWY